MFDLSDLAISGMGFQKSLDGLGVSGWGGIFDFWNLLNFAKPLI